MSKPAPKKRFLAIHRLRHEEAVLRWFEWIEGENREGTSHDRKRG